MRRIAALALAAVVALPMVVARRGGRSAGACRPSAPPSRPRRPSRSPPPEPTPAPTRRPPEPTPAPEPTPDPIATRHRPPSRRQPPIPDRRRPVRTAAPKATAQSAPEALVDAKGRPIATGRYIVVLAGSADTTEVLTRHRQREGTKAERSFKHAFRGFTARLDTAQRRALLADPSVLAVVPDEVI